MRNGAALLEEARFRIMARFRKDCRRYAAARIPTMKYTEEEVDLIAADNFRELTYKQKKYFLAAEKEGVGAKYADALIKIFGGGVYNKLRKRFRDGGYRGKLLEELDKRRTVCFTVKSAAYPEALRSIPVPPLVLYLRGNAALLERALLGVVGSRRTTPQALEECRKMCARLSERLVVVTGVADGADRAAAEGALKSGNVVCVLPGGHDGAFGNATLREVEERGLSVSEFPPLFPAQRYTFLLRNRVLAGLCRGVLVVSAAKKSGALSTASYAADYGRDVFAFPYGIGIPSGEGCNLLIKKGAYLCDRAEDVFAQFGVDCGAEAEEERGEEESEEERAVLAALRAEGEMHAENLAEAVGKSLSEVSAVCALLEIKGKIVRTGGNRYAAL